MWASYEILSWGYPILYRFVCPLDYLFIYNYSHVQLEGIVGLGYNGKRIKVHMFLFCVCSHYNKRNKQAELEVAFEKHNWRSANQKRHEKKKQTKKLKPLKIKKKLSK